MQNKLQHALDLCNKNKFDEALQILEEIIKEDSKNSEAWRTLAQIHWLHQHNPEKAFNELIEALKCDPKNIWALVLMGNFLTKEKNDVAHAKEYYDKVLEYHPNNGIAINNIGATYMERNDYEGALPYMEKALLLNDTYMNSYYGLGICYYKLGRLEEAFSTCHRGAQKSIDRPENPAVRQELIRLYLTVAKDLANKTNYINVWKGIKDELEAVDHVNILFEEDKSLNVLAKLEYAPWHATNEHVIRYNPDKEYIDHLFIHEMMHLKLNQQATKAKRGKVIVSSKATNAAFNKRYLKFMQKNLSHIPSSELGKVISGLADGLGLQLMNCPLDLFVEHMMYSNYEVARPIQLLSLFHMEQDNIDSVKRTSKAGLFPKEIIQANKVMNIVTSMHFKELYGIDLIHEYNPSKFEYNQAKDLYDEFKAYLDTYKNGDEYEMMEYFIQSFNMEDLVEIVDEYHITNKMKANPSMHSDFKNGRTDIQHEDDVDVANASFALNHQDGANPTETMMMSMYMLGAMEYLDTLEPSDVHRIALEIAMVGVTGIDPKGKYSINSIPGKEFGGYQFLAYYYVSWARAIPEKLELLGLPFSKAYESALQMYNKKNDGK